MDLESIQLWIQTMLFPMRETNGRPSMECLLGASQLLPFQCPSSLCYRSHGPWAGRWACRGHHFVAFGRDDLTQCWGSIGARFENCMALDLDHQSASVIESRPKIDRGFRAFLSSWQHDERKGPSPAFCSTALFLPVSFMAQAPSLMDSRPFSCSGHWIQVDLMYTHNPSLVPQRPFPRLSCLVL